MSDFERWEKRYGAPGYLFGMAPNAFLAPQADRLRERETALSVADGEGRNGVWLAEQGLDVLAVDYSPTALAKAATLARERGVRLRTEVADLTRWHWPRAAFDVVAAIFAHFAGAERDAFFANLKNALKPGGLLLMQSYRPEQLAYRTGGPPDAERMVTRALLEQAFGDWAEFDIREHDSVIDEGTGHVGRSTLSPSASRAAVSNAQSSIVRRRAAGYLRHAAPGAFRRNTCPDRRHSALARKERRGRPPLACPCSPSTP
jgi:SAM-dependent methyltransferase